MTMHTTKPSPNTGMLSTTTTSAVATFLNRITKVKCVIPLQFVVQKANSKQPIRIQMPDNGNTSNVCGVYDKQLIQLGYSLLVTCTVSYGTLLVSFMYKTYLITYNQVKQIISHEGIVSVEHIKLRITDISTFLWYHTTHLSFPHV